MIYRFLMGALLAIAFQTHCEAGRFDIYYDINDEEREAKAIITSADGKVLKERTLKYGLNSFEDIPVYACESKGSANPVENSVLFVEFQNISENIDSVIYWIHEGSLGTIDENELSFDPPHLLGYLAPTRSQ